MAWEIAFIIFLLSLTVLVYLTIPVVLRLKDTLKKANKTLEIVNKELPQLLNDLSDITRTLNSVSGKIEETVEDVAQLEKLVSKEIKTPLQNIANTIATLLQLINRLFDLKKSK